MAASTPATSPRPASPKPAAGASKSAALSLDDEAILTKCRRAKNSPKFGRLHDHGDWAGYTSESEGVFALLGILAFYTDDAGQLERIMGRSAFAGEGRKWSDREDYRSTSIANALEGKTKSYTPPPPPPRLGAGREQTNGDGHAPGGERQGDPEAPGPDDGEAGPTAEAEAPGHDAAVPRERPAIEISTERHEVVDATIKALAADPDLYRRGNMLVQVIDEPNESVPLTGKTTLAGVRGTPSIVSLSDAITGCFLTRNATFFQWRKAKGGRGLSADVHPPDWLIKAVATRKVLAGHPPAGWPSSSAPTPGPTGRSSRPAGIRPARRGTLYRPSIEFPPVPAAADPGGRRGRLGADRGVVGQFPFATEDDEAVFLAALLTVIARPGDRRAGPGHRRRRQQGRVRQGPADRRHRPDRRERARRPDLELPGRPGRRRPKVKVAIALRRQVGRPLRQPGRRARPTATRPSIGTITALDHQRPHPGVVEA